MSSTMKQEADELTAAVREKYGAAARRVLTGEGTPAECCGSSGCCGGAVTASCDPISSNLYVAGETNELPEAAVLASLGCGNPTALAELREGEVVLDLGSGGGIDVLLSARRVGPTGKAYGLDMTDDMLSLARKNAAEAGVTNVAFLVNTGVDADRIATEVSGRVGAAFVRATKPIPTAASAKATRSCGCADDCCT